MGKRARYVSPLALFLLCVFFMFFAFSFLHAPPGGINLGDDRADAVSDLREARGDLATAEREQAQAAAHPDPDMPAGLQARLTQQQVTLAQAAVHRAEAALARIDRHGPHPGPDAQSDATTTAQEEGASVQATTVPTQSTRALRTGAAPTGARASSAGATNIRATNTGATNTDATNIAATSTPTTLASTQVGGINVNANTGGEPGVHVTTSGPAPEAQRWQDQIEASARNGTLKINTGWPLLDAHLREKALNPDLALYKMQDAAYKWSFLLVPISLPFIGFLFLFKKGITLYDHTVYALNSLSFASLAFIAVILTVQYPPLKFIGDSVIAFVIPIHTYFHLKGAYALRWWSALWRTFFVLMFASIALALYLVIILILGLAG
jgi:hypothetical protein